MISRSNIYVWLGLLALAVVLFVVSQLGEHPPAAASPAFRHVDARWLVDNANTKSGQVVEWNVICSRPSKSAPTYLCGDYSALPIALTISLISGPGAARLDQCLEDGPLKGCDFKVRFRYDGATKNGRGGLMIMTKDAFVELLRP